MFKKLKKSFVTFCMTLLSLLMLAVFGITAFLMIINSNRICGGLLDAALNTSRDVLRIQERALLREKIKESEGQETEAESAPEAGEEDSQPSSEGSKDFPAKGPVPPAEKGWLPEEDHRFSVGSVIVDVCGENLNWIFAPDQEIAQTAVNLALEEGAQAGDVSFDGYNFAYKSQPIAGGFRLAMVDISGQRRNLRNTLLIIFGVCLTTLAFLYILSHSFAKRAITPIKEAFDKQKTFVADASHELKTPLSVLNANLSVLQSDPEQSVGSQQQWLNAMEDQTRRMNGLINDMLLLARMDAGVIDMPKCPVDLGDLLRGVLLSFEAVLFEKGIRLNSQIEEGIFVVGCREKLSRLAYILLDNAGKHTPAGEEVRATLRRERNQAIFCVYNNGPAIPPEQLERIFDRFYRADSARARQDGGCGLGLAIAKSIAEEAGGSIRAQSGGQGTVFTVKFPLYNG
jgi:two-component system sensor histidine kinase CiaH